MNMIFCDNNFGAPDSDSVAVASVSYVRAAIVVKAIYALIDRVDHYSA